MRPSCSRRSIPPSASTRTRTTTSARPRFRSWSRGPNPSKTYWRDPTMANPEKLKLVKEHSHKAITFAIARVPESTRIYLACSDFKVYEADVAAEKFEPKELYA